jgi:hypothetical protein
VWTISHALTDGWSSKLIIQAVKQAYLFYPVTRLEPFKSFSGLTNAEQEAKEKAYWTEQLRGAHHVSAFPPSPSIDFRPRTDSWLNKEIQLDSGRYKTPYRMPLILRAAWALTMSAASHSSDVVFGMALNGRNNSSAEGIIGPMVATVPVRVQINMSANLAKFLDELHEQSVGMMEFEHTGLHVISGYGPEFRRACGFQSLLVIQVFMREDFHAHEGSNMNENKLDWLDGSEGEQDASQALVVDCLAGPTNIEVRVSFDSRVINRQAVQHVVSMFATIVGSLRQDCRKIDVKVRDVLGSVKELVPPDKVDSLGPSKQVDVVTRSVRIQEQDVNLDEIEAVIQQMLPERSMCMVDLCRPADVSLELLTCIVSGFPKSEKDTAGFIALVKHIISSLASTLPQVMVPAAFLPVDHLVEPELLQNTTEIGPS